MYGFYGEIRVCGDDELFKIGVVLNGYKREWAIL